MNKDVAHLNYGHVYLVGILQRQGLVYLMMRQAHIRRRRMGQACGKYTHEKG
jgi:hypothetical protein